MSEYIAEKYSELLTKEDVIKLFKEMGELGTLTDICRVIGIDKKTVYNWDKVKEIRRSTKTKILSVALKHRPKETLEFLVDRGIERTTELLFYLIEYIYEKAMKSKEPEEFEIYFKEFTRITKKYSKPIIEPIRREVNQLCDFLMYKAKRMSIVSDELTSIEVSPEYTGYSLLKEKELEIKPEHLITSSGTITWYNQHIIYSKRE